MVYYDLELIDINENVENFQFHKIEKEDLDKAITNFKENKSFIEFKSIEGFIIMKTDHIRGIMYQEYEEKEKNIVQENIEAAEEVSKVKLKKTVFNTTKESKI